MGMGNNMNTIENTTMANTVMEETTLEGIIMGSAITAIKNQSKRNKTVTAALAALCVAALVAFGTGSFASAAPAPAPEKGTQDPDMIYTRDEAENPGYYTSVTVPDTVKDYLDLKDTEQYDDNGDTTGVGDKEAFWTNNTKTEADIVIAYKKPIKPALMLTGVCYIHDLTTEHLKQQVNTITATMDLGLYIEANDFLGTTYNGVQTRNSATGDRAADEHSGRLELVAGDTLEIRRQSASQKSGIFQIQHEGTVKDITPASSNTNTGILMMGTLDGGGIDTSGSHSNMIAYARDIVDYFTAHPDPLEQPDFIVISFDEWAWAAGSVAVETGGGQGDTWKEDAAVMRQAAEILKPYYERNAVLCLTQTGTFRNGNDFPSIATNSDRETFAAYLYPDDLNDFFAPSQSTGVTVGMTGQQVRDADVANHSQVFSDYGRNAGFVRYANGSPIRNTQEGVNYFLGSKRLAFYQFALLAPDLYLQSTAEDGTPTAIPTFDDWYAETSQHKYENYASNTQPVIEDMVTAYNRLEITDTVVERLEIKEDEIQVFYNAGTDENPDWQLVPLEYGDGKTDGYEISVEGQKVTCVINNLDVIGHEVRLRIPVKTKDGDGSFYRGEPESAEKRETNEGDVIVKRINTEIPSKVFKDYTIETPYLHKNPVVEVAATKKWVGDYDNSFNTREDILLHVDRTPQGGQKVDDILPAQKIEKENDSREVTVTWGKLWGEGYTAGGGTEVSAEDNVLYGYDEDGKPYTYSIRETNTTNEGGELVAYTPTPITWEAAADTGTPVQWEDEPYDMGYRHDPEDFVNTFKTTNVAITKEWVDAKDSHSASELEDVFDLYALWNDANTEVTGTSIGNDPNKYTYPDPTISPVSGKSFAVTWEKLPKYRGTGEANTLPTEIVYNVAEPETFSGYADPVYSGDTIETDGATSVKTGGTIRNIQLIKVNVVKQWDDANNQDGKRDAIGVTLYLDGEPFVPVVADEENEATLSIANATQTTYFWMPVWTKVPYAADDGTVHEFTARETTVPEGYTAAPADAAALSWNAAKDTLTFNVKNTYTPKLVDISIDKIWNDSGDAYELRGDNASATVVLEKSTDGGENWAKVTDTGVANDVLVPDTNKQITQWTNLPAYENGALITYRVTETGLASTYTAAYTGGTGSANNEFAYSGAAAKASATMTVTNTCDYDADPPTDTGETFKGRYTSNGSDQSQDWTPSSWIDEVKNYAKQPDGSPNEIESFTLVDANGKEVTTLTTDEGTYVIDPQTGKVTFTPAPGFTQGKASTVTVRAKDKVGAITGKYPQATYTPEVVDNKQEATAVRNITYTYLTADGTEASRTVQQTVKLVRYGTVDETAKTVSYESASWQPADDANKDFPAQTSPAIEGWKASGNAAGQTPNPNTDVQAVYDEATGTFIYPDLHVLYVPQNAGTDERMTTDGKFTSVGGLQEQKSGSFANLADKLTTKTLPDGSANTITGYALIDPETGEEVPGGTLVIEGEGTYTIDPATGEVTFTPDVNFPGGAATRVEVRAKDKLSAVLDETVATLQGRISDIDEELADINEQLAALDEAADGYEEQKAALEAQKAALAEEQATARAQVEEYSNYQVPSGFYTPNVVLNAETATPSRTITYTYYTVDGDQVQENVVQTLEFTRYGTYNPETGEVEYDNSTWIAKDGKDTFDAVNSPSLEGTGGTGWHTDTEVVSALKVVDPTKPIEDVHVVYTPTGGTAVEDYWVTYIDPATGRVIQDKIYQPKTTDEPPAPADPTRDGYTFDGWDREVDADGNITYKAKWVPVSTPEPPAPINWVRYIDSDGSTVYLPQTDWTIGTTEPAAPEDPTKEGYTFDGWDRTVDEDGNVTYIARWKPAETPQPEPEPQPSPSPTPTPSPSPQPSVRTTPVPTGTSASGVAVQATPKTADSAPYIPAAVVLVASVAAMALSRRRLQAVRLAPAASVAARAGKHARKE